MGLEGGCYGGVVRHVAEGDRVLELQCYCRECQYITGGMPTSSAFRRRGFACTEARRSRSGVVTSTFRSRASFVPGVAPVSPPVVAASRCGAHQGQDARPAGDVWGSEGRHLHARQGALSSAHRRSAGIRRLAGMSGSATGAGEAAAWDLCCNGPASMGGAVLAAFQLRRSGRSVT
jgi:hypothetical protein